MSVDNGEGGGGGDHYYGRREGDHGPEGLKGASYISLAPRRGLVFFARPAVRGLPSAPGHTSMRTFFQSTVFAPRVPDDEGRDPSPFR